MKPHGALNSVVPGFLGILRLHFVLYLRLSDVAANPDSRHSGLLRFLSGRLLRFWRVLRWRGLARPRERRQEEEQPKNHRTPPESWESTACESRNPRPKN